jgi:hypothetical protein
MTIQNANVPSNLYGRVLHGEECFIVEYVAPTEADVLAQVALDFAALEEENSVEGLTCSIVNQVSVVDAGPNRNEPGVRSDVLFRLCPLPDSITDDEWHDRFEAALPNVKPIDPELEALLAEEEEIERARRAWIEYTDEMEATRAEERAFRENQRIWQEWLDRQATENRPVAPVSDQWEAARRERQERLMQSVDPNFPPLPEDFSD